MKIALETVFLRVWCFAPSRWVAAILARLGRYGG